MTTGFNADLLAAGFNDCVTHKNIFLNRFAVQVALWLKKVSEAGAFNVSPDPSRKCGHNHPIYWLLLGFVNFLEIGLNLNGGDRLTDDSDRFL